jgi:hypothetical protein
MFIANMQTVRSCYQKTKKMKIMFLAWMTGGARLYIFEGVPYEGLAGLKYTY